MPSQLRIARLASKRLHLSKEPMTMFWTWIITHGTEESYPKSVFVDLIQPKGESETDIDWIVFLQVVHHCADSVTPIGGDHFA
jgi:hypothetical protein